MIEPRIQELVEQAFDYRGFVTLSKRDGSKTVGFVFNRDEETLELFNEKATEKTRIALAEITDVAFTGEDTAEKAAKIWERRKGSLEPVETSAWGDWDSQRPALIIVALEHELNGVAKALGAKVRGNVARGRLGEGAAVAVAVGLGGGAKRAVETERPRLVINCGFSGALDATLQPGDLILASSIREESGEVMKAQESLLLEARTALAGTHFFEGELFCATRVAATAAEKRALGGAGRLAVDLESWPAARAAQEMGIPWLSVRAIIDPLESDLPPFTRHAEHSYIKPAMRYALTGPRAIADLAQLGFRAHAATKSLQRALKLLAPVLANAGRPEHKS